MKKVGQIYPIFRIVFGQLKTALLNLKSTVFGQFGEIFYKPSHARAHKELSGKPSELSELSDFSDSFRTVENHDLGSKPPVFGQFGQFYGKSQKSDSWVSKRAFPAQLSDGRQVRGLL